MTKSRNIMRKRWKPDAVALELVRRNFSCSKTQDLADVLGVQYHQVVKLASRMGLKKDEAWLNSPASGRTDGLKGMGTRFQKGAVSWSKGRTLGPQWSRATQFKPGQRPPNVAAIGDLRIESGGYLQIKRSLTGYPPRDWLMFHRHVWQQAHGPIPPKHVVIFKDGRRRTDPTEITADVLECISQAEHMRRQSFHRYGPEVAAVVHMRSRLTRQINRKSQRQAEAQEAITP